MHSMNPLHGSNCNNNPKTSSSKVDSPTTKKIKLQQDKIGKAKSTDDLNLKGKKIDVDIDDVNSSSILRDKDSVFWRCVYRKPGKNGGYLYTFKLKEEYQTDPKKYDRDLYDKIKQAETDAQPANEPSRHAEKFPGGTQTFTNKSTPAIQIMEQLGYSSYQKDKGTFITLPDADYVHGEWELLREKYPTLPPLAIISSQGIAGDIEFTESFLLYDYLLSDKGEFVHDNTDHMYDGILSTIQVMLHLLNHPEEVNELDKIKKHLLKTVAQYHQKIQIAKSVIESSKVITDEQREQLKKSIPQFEVMLSVFADIASGNKVEDMQMYADIPDSELRLQIITGRLNPNYQKSFSRFGDLSSIEQEEGMLLVQQLDEQLSLIEKVADDYLQKRKTKSDSS